LQLRFWLLEMGNHQDHALVVFNHNTHKVVKDTIFYAHIQANNLYCKDVLHQKMNKKLGSLAIYFIEEKYRQIKN
jgi:hypothetical protein